MRRLLKVQLRRNFRHEKIPANHHDNLFQDLTLISAVDFQVQGKLGFRLRQIGKSTVFVP